VRGRKVVVGDGDHPHPGCNTCPDPVGRVLNDGAGRRDHVEPSGGFQVDVGRRFASGHFLRGNGDVEERREVSAIEDEVDDRSVGRRGQAETPPGRHPLDRIGCPGKERQSVLVKHQDPGDDLVVDLLGTELDAQPLAQVDRPFG
jgi:hypothetical protein